MTIQFDHLDSGEEKNKNIGAISKFAFSMLMAEKHSRGMILIINREKGIGLTTFIMHVTNGDDKWLTFFTALKWSLVFQA